MKSIWEVYDMSIGDFELRQNSCAPVGAQAQAESFLLG